MSTEGLLHARFLRHAEEQPTAPALRSGAGDVSYGELADRAARFAGHLCAQGLERGDRVALLLDNGVEYPIACYGTLLAGGVVVPLCPETKGTALTWTLEHAGARVLVTNARSARALQAEALPPGLCCIVAGPERVALELGYTCFADAIAAAPLPTRTDLLPQDLCAIHYTSGTTGRPKGVMLEHRQLAANVRSIVEYLELTPNDVAGLALPLYYVYGSSVLHTHFASGGAIALLTSLAFAQRTLEDMEHLRATGFSGVPSSFAKLVPLLEREPRDLPDLRYLTQAGAGMPKDLTQRVRAAFPRARLFVMYGQTEASARLAYLPPERLDEKLGSAGRAIPDVELEVIDEHGRRLPPYEDGEVLARGPNIMRGYWQDPEATARTLQFGGLRTGDLGHLDAEGYLWLIGRQSELIKSGGHRIGPGEIEAVVATLPAVVECGVTGLPDPELGERVAAFVVLREGAALELAELQRHCLNELPRFKVPAELHRVEALPRTPSGKLQRRRLAEVLHQT